MARVSREAPNCNNQHDEVSAVKFLQHACPLNVELTDTEHGKRTREDESGDPEGEIR
jgi:hypothetical protein